jgi:sigma-54 specific flagellar transcriptional regulator A
MPAEAKCRFDDAAMALLMQHRWPGNVRELRNFVERASVLHGGEMLGSGDVAMLLNPTAVPQAWQAVPSSPVAVQTGAEDPAVPAPAAAHAKTPAPGRPIDLKREIETIELEQIHVALDLADGIISEAARLLTLKRTTLIEKMRKYGVHQQAA